MMKPPLGSMIEPGHPLSRGLVLCLLMNEGAGTRIHDISGNNNHGVLTNGPLWKPGRDGAAVAFPGVNGGGYVLYPQIWSGTTFTVLIWIYPKTPTKTYCSVLTQATTAGIFLRGSAGGAKNLFVDVYFSAAPHNNNTPLTDNALNLFGLSVLSGSGIYYLNGRADGTVSNVVTMGFSLSGNDASNESLSGLISSVSIYNRALSAQEVADLYINPYAFIHQPRKYWLMPQGGMVPPHLLFRRAA
ncbi:MAG: LamG-like jellyroll fold domain-containing protein [Desulfosalsimonadaceae bacterium]